MEQAKNDNFDDIVNLLDLFKGELTLTDALNQDIPILNKLRDAKLRQNKMLAKAAADKTKKMAAQQAQNQAIK